MDLNFIQKNLETIHLPPTTKLVAVSKRKPISMIKAAYQTGQRIFGENYMSEAVEKIKELKDLPDIQWHFIGPLQSNKTKDAATYFDVIHTVDRIKIARRLNDFAMKLDKTLEILIQINIGNEPQKSGISIEDLPELIAYLEQCQFLQWTGFMCIPPFEDDSTPYFKEMQAIFQEYQKKYPITELSMGMSGDYTQAVNYGATMVRIGTKIFGKRT